MLRRYVFMDQLLVREVLPPAALELLTSTLASLASCQASTSAGHEETQALQEVPQQAALIIAQVHLFPFRHLMQRDTLREAKKGHKQVEATHQLASIWVCRLPPLRPPIIWN